MKIGLAGAGRIGRFHGRTLADHPAVSALRVMDVDAGRAASLAADVGAETAPDAAALVEWADALVIAASTDAHAGLVGLGADAGLPVFCEKPIALDLETTDRVLERVEAAGIPLQIGFQRRFDPAWAEARRLVASGELGTVYSARSTTHDPALPHPGYIGGSGGLYVDMMVHDFDAITWTTGQQVEEVHAVGAALTGDEELLQHRDVDTALVVMRLDGGALGVASGLRHNPPGYDVRLELFGSKDSVTAGVNSRMPVRPLDEDRESSGAPLYQQFLDRFEDAYRAELDAFLSLARGEIETPCSGAESREVLRVAIAATLSAREGRPVRVSEIV